MRRNLMIVAAIAASVLVAPAAQANEGRGKPFITAAHYQKNISLAEFRVNPRSYFVSEEAFRLIVRYVGDEVGRPSLTAAEFVALIRSDQVRVRSCNAGESINTGALSGNQFHWFVRRCRPGEEILQVNGKDRISLSCLNAVEDQTPTPPPTLVYRQPPPPPAKQRCRWVAVSQTQRQSAPLNTPGFILRNGCCEGCGIDTFIPGQSIDMGSSGSTTYEMICD